MSGDRVPTIDAHHHVWDPARADQPWMTDGMAAIRRPFTIDDLVPALDAAGIDATVLVQTRSSIDESLELLATAAGSSRIAGVVAWVDLTTAAVADDIAALAAAPGGAKLVAIRHQVQDEPDAAWLGRADVRRGLRAVEAAGLAYDLLVRPRELTAAVEVARAMPGLRFVLDHVAKPPIADRAWEPWASRLVGFRDLDHVACKVSGLVTEARWSAWTVEDLAPYAALALDVFGPARLAFGSDWPVSLLAAPYATVLDAARRLTAGLSGGERERVFGGTAIEVYGLRVEPARG